MGEPEAVVGVAAAADDDDEVVVADEVVAADAGSDGVAAYGDFGVLEAVTVDATGVDLAGVEGYGAVVVQS